VNIVDSSGWLEYFAGGPSADFFAPALEAVDELVVPTVSIYEVFKRVLGSAARATRSGRRHSCSRATSWNCPCHSR
jgi:predicted nucleic acid-binding protein